MHSSKKGGTLEKSSGVLLLKSKELTGGLSELGESEVASPYFSFILEPVFADELEFVINSFLLIRPPGSLEGGGIYIRGDVQLR